MRNAAALQTGSRAPTHTDLIRARASYPSPRLPSLCQHVAICHQPPFLLTLSPSWPVHLHLIVTIPAVTPTFSSTSRPAASPEVPHDTSSGHVPLGSHVIHPRAPSSRPMPRDPISRPRWVRLQESPPSTPDAPDEPESSTDPWIDSTVLTEDLSILQGLLSGLPMSLWSAVMDLPDGH